MSRFEELDRYLKWRASLRSEVEAPDASKIEESRKQNDGIIKASLAVFDEFY